MRTTNLTVVILGYILQMEDVSNFKVLIKYWKEAEIQKKFSKVVNIPLHSACQCFNKQLDRMFIQLRAILYMYSVQMYVVE